jgi:hypothetical protein
MDINEVSRLTKRWQDSVKNRKIEYAPDAKVITGDYKLDLAIHHFEQDSGMVVKLTRTGLVHLITGYEIVDEEKFTWFMLRYS